MAANKPPIRVDSPDEPDGILQRIGEFVDHALYQLEEGLEKIARILWTLYHSIASDIGVLRTREGPSDRREPSILFATGGIMELWASDSWLGAVGKTGTELLSSDRRKEFTDNLRVY